jgi:hypothetical protein
MAATGAKVRLGVTTLQATTRIPNPAKAAVPDATQFPLFKIHIERANAGSQQ